MSKTINLGAVTAYADAVAAGYTGTREQFAQDLANAANYAAQSHADAQTASDAAETATAAASAASLDADAAHDDAATAHADAQAALSFKESAETAAGTATTKAGEAANSASQAATSASGAAGSATAASGSATAAAGSATNAAASETAAAGSATSAAGSASAAAQALVDVNTAGATQVAAIAAKGAEVLESIPSDYTKLSQDVDDLKSDLNAFALIMTSGYFINYSNGVPISSEYWAISNKFPVNAISKVRIITHIYGSASIGFYDVNDNYVQGIKDDSATSSSGVKEYILDVPDSADYVRFSCENTAKNNAFVNVYDLYDDFALLSNGASGKYTRTMVSEAVEDGYLIKKNGDKAVSSGWECSDYIEVLPSETTMLHCFAYGTGGLCFYDQSYNAVLGIDGSNIGDYGGSTSSYAQDITVNTPSNAKYVRFSSIKANAPVTSFSIRYQIPWNTKYSDLLSVVSQNSLHLNEIIKSENVDVTALATLVENQFYNINNQTYAGGNQWNYFTYEVTPGMSFDIDTVAGGTVRGWAFRDAQHNQLAIASYNGDVVQKKYENVVAPPTATELIVNIKFIDGYCTIIRNDEVVIDDKKVFYNGKPLSTYLDNPAQLSNILYGKTLCCCGDSITYGADMTGDELVKPEIEAYQWSGYNKKWTRWVADEPATYGYQIAARNNMVFYNGGVSGATVQAKSGSMSVPGFSDANGEYTLLPDNIDYLTLFFGWNDTAVGTLGSITDSTPDSYYGAYNVVLPYLIDKYPYTKIALIVPFGTDVGHRQAIRDLANKWGLACFDMYKEGTPLYWGKEPDVDVDPAIVTSNREKFWAQTNSPHPNIHGHYQISTMLEAFLRGI